MGIVSAMAVPMTASSMAAYRLRGDSQSLNNLVALAKMRAASRFTRARVYVDRAANTYRLEVFDRTVTPNTWAVEGGTYNTSNGVRFGFGSLSTPPPNTQNTISMSAACTDDAGATIAATSCIVFNSRGVPISMPGGAPTGNNAFYVTNGQAVYATTVTATPLVRFWWSPSGTAGWLQQ